MASGAPSLQAISNGHTIETRRGSDYQSSIRRKPGERPIGRVERALVLGKWQSHLVNAFVASGLEFVARQASSFSAFDVYADIQLLTK